MSVHFGAVEKRRRLSRFATAVKWKVDINWGGNPTVKLHFDHIFLIVSLFFGGDRYPLQKKSSYPMCINVTLGIFKHRRSYTNTNFIAQS